MTMDLNLDRWKTFVETLDINARFVTVSGAHLYGFPSPDSDVDLRGCHQTPLANVVGLKIINETFDHSTITDGTEVDIVSHDIGKYFGLLVKNNGYVLEQIYSPLIVCGEEFLARLRPIASQCITRFHYHHYRGFYATQRKLIDKEKHKRAKPVLYAYRVLMTGIHLMKTGEVEANLVHLNGEFRFSFIDELIASKTEEKIAPMGLDWEFHSKQLDNLETALGKAFESSALPENRDYESVNDFLVELRLSELA